MKELIIVATDIEIKPFLLKNGFTDDMEQGKVYTISDRFDLMITGPGIPQTLLYLAAYFQEYLAKGVIQLGFAGSYNSDIEPGMMVETIEDCFGDQGIDDRGTFIPFHALTENVSMNSGVAAGWLRSLRIEKGEEKNCFAKLRKVKGITVSMGSGSQGRIELMLTSWSPDVETMEGAAALLYCNENDLPFRQIRSVSNWVEPRDFSRWKTELAAQKLSEWLSLFIRE
ncbi:MAG: hypothetical protein HOD37_07140 [Bacteroidetes bacterium]|nr:hypothetical protein [Bacteroidota bacterium]